MFYIIFDNITKTVQRYKKSAIKNFEAKVLAVSANFITILKLKTLKLFLIFSRSAALQLSFSNNINLATNNQHLNAGLFI